MSWMEDSDRTIPATPRRRADARRRGAFPFSADLNTALFWGGTALWLIWQGPTFVTACGNWLRHSLLREPVLRPHDLTYHPLISGSFGFTVMGWLLAFWIMSIAVRWLQVGPIWAPENVQPCADRVNPFEGIGRLFSASSGVRGNLWLLRVVSICGMLMVTLYSQANLLSEWPSESSEVIAVQLGELFVSMVLRVCGVLLGIAAIDLSWQWWQHERRLRMTVEEWRREQQEGQRRRTSPAPANQRASQSNRIVLDSTR